ncbi:MAG: hypothetical protein NTW86_25930 [Candidatus Sumerlaeota bacterium]|nr:hypothetical protein [Candidatus Sumerlaeota bacterium]
MFVRLFGRGCPKDGNAPSRAIDSKTPQTNSMASQVNSMAFSAVSLPEWQDIPAKQPLSLKGWRNGRFIRGTIIAKPISFTAPRVFRRKIGSIHKSLPINDLRAMRTVFSFFFPH